jgi:hypothetical protein
VAVDVLTGDVLVDVLVNQSGLTKAYFSDAREKGKLVKSVAAARKQLFEWNDENTILVGHALENALRPVGIRHTKLSTHNGVNVMNVIDTQILARNEVRKVIAIQPKWKDGEPPSGLSKLQHLSKSLCGHIIQADLVKGHDCVEDVYAAREVLLVINDSRQKLEDWATEYVRRSRIRIVGPVVM